MSLKKFFLPYGDRCQGVMCKVQVFLAGATKRCSEWEIMEGFVGLCAQVHTHPPTSPTVCFCVSYFCLLDKRGSSNLGQGLWRKGVAIPFLSIIFSKVARFLFGKVLTGVDPWSMKSWKWGFAG